MKPLTWLFSITGLFWTASLGTAQPNFVFFEPVQPARKVQIMVHRGMHMLAPENSLAAIMGCAGDFIEWAEVDVRLSKDHKHFIMHDSTVDRCTTSKGNAFDFTLDELLKMEAGSPFAKRFTGTRLITHAELLAKAKGQLNLYLDCKNIDPELLVKEILEAGMEKQVIVYDGLENIARVKKFSANKVPVMTKFRPVTMNFDSFVNEVAPAAVEIDADQITVELCRKFHAKGIKVQSKVLGPAWDNPATWTSMIQAGVDWLQTDDPLGVRFTEVRMRIPKFAVKIAFHRGASRYAPENTLPAITRAATARADYIEIDIRPTRDGTHVLLHDSRLDRTTGAKGPVKEMDLETVRGLNAGAWFGNLYARTMVPTLDEALAAYGDTSHAYLDAKDISPEALVAAIKKHRMIDRHVIYQSADYCRRIKELDSSVKTIPGLKSAGDLGRILVVKPYGVDASWSILSKDFIRDCHEKGIKVFSDALGLNESINQYRRAIGWGIDVIQTDYPLRVLRAIELENPG